MRILFIVVFGAAFVASSVRSDDPDRLPTRCEICKYLTNEMSESLTTHNSPELIETGYSLDERLDKKKAKKYRDSELRLIEVLEELCEKILQYNVHAERKGSLRYSKGESQTMSTLKGLRDRGVKVELGIPYDLWDTPSAEITQLKKYCDSYVEMYEEEIETWYKNERNKVTLTEYLCERVILKDNEKECLNEKFVEEKKDESDDEKKKKKTNKKNDAEL